MTELKQLLNKVDNLGEEVIQLSRIRKWKYQFREIWLKELIERYKNKPGSPTIHLSNLPENVRIILNEEGIERLRKFYKQAINVYGWYKIKDPFGSYIYKYINRELISLSIKRLKILGKLLGIDINSFEPYVTAFGVKGSTKFLKIKQLPIHLDNKYGVTLLGLFPDVARSGYGMNFEDDDMIERGIEAVSQVFGRIEPSKSKPISFSKLIPCLLSCAGIDTELEQLKANNPAPIWLFSLSLEHLKHYLSSLWDSEGTVNIRAKSLYLTQGVFVDLTSFNRDGRTSFGQLSNEIKEKILDSPPLLLVSNLLLLRLIEIKSRLRPKAVYKRKGDSQGVAIWNLEIYAYENLQKFHDKIKFKIPRKNERVQTLLNSYKRRIRAKGQGYNTILKKAVEFEKFSKYDLARAVNRSVNTINHFIQILKKRNHIKLDHKNKRIAIYYITKEGMRYYNKVKVTL